MLTTTICNPLGHCTLRIFFRTHAERMLQPRSADTKMFCSKMHMSRISGYGFISFFGENYISVHDSPERLQRILKRKDLSSQIVFNLS